MVVATDVSWVPSGYSNDTEDFYAEIKDNPNVLAATMDITIPAHVDWVYKQTIAKFGTVDVLICNGGTRQRDLYLDSHGSVTVLETEVADWERMFATHVFGNLRVIKRFIEPMIEKGRGSIITSASGQILNAHPAATADENARPGLRFGLSREGPYQPAKMALGAMCLYLAEELRGTNIAVNVLLPGHTATTGSDEQEAVRNADPPAHEPHRRDLHPPPRPRRQRRPAGPPPRRAGRRGHHRPLDRRNGLEPGERLRRLRDLGRPRGHRGPPSRRPHVTRSLDCNQCEGAPHQRPFCFASITHPFALSPSKGPPSHQSVRPEPTTPPVRPEPVEGPPPRHTGFRRYPEGQVCFCVRRGDSRIARPAIAGPGGAVGKGRSP